ncbi:MAG: class F sortase [Dehalococcoidia bacterium]|nr:class F sortase [Dehalococcoidia bacterium]
MKIAPKISLLTLLAGAITLVGAAACGGGDDTPAATTAATTTEAAASVATSTPTMPPTPTATPTPFNGTVARFKYPRFGIDAPVEALATNAEGELDTPSKGKENTDVAWYDQDLEKNGYGIGTKPGWGGNAVFSAHVYYISKAVCPSNPMACPAPFQKLAQASVGDEISVVMANGTEYKYKVISKKQYSRDNIPMGDIINPPDKPAGKEWITMITCGGALDASGLEYVSRDVVVAERVS